MTFNLALICQAIVDQSMRQGFLDMKITAKVIVEGQLQVVSVMAQSVVYFFRDDNSGLVRLRLADGSDAVTDLRIARVIEILDQALENADS